MSLCNIPFLTSLEPLHVFASNFLWMVLGWTSAKFDKIEVLPVYFMVLLVIVCTDLLQSLCGCFLGRSLLCLNQGGTPIFDRIMGNFVQFFTNLKKSYIKSLTRNHSYLVWRVPRGPSYYYLQIRSL